MAGIEEIKDDIKEIKSSIKDIENIINGKDGEKGMAAKVQDHEAYIKKAIEKKDDILTYVFRAALSVAIFYICWKLNIPTR